MDILAMSARMAPLMCTSPKFRISRMGTAYGLGEEYGISTPENLVKGLAYVRTANPLKGFCKCTDKLYGLLNLVDRINTC